MCRWHLLSSFCLPKHRAACVLSFAALLLPHAAHADKKAKVPDWVAQAASQPIPAYSNQPAAVYLLSDIEYGVNAQGRSSERVREVWKILRPKDRDGLSTALAGYQKSLEEVKGFHAWSIAPDGTSYAIEDKDIHDFDAQQDFELYSDSRMMAAKLPADVGSIVAVEYTRNSKPYITEYVWSAQRSYPVLKERLVLAMPPGFTYKAVWKGGEAAKARDLENGRTLWEMNDVAGVDTLDIPLSPAARTLFKRLDVHYAGPGLPQSTNGTWKGIGEWYESLAKGRNEANAAIEKKTQELIAGKTDLAERAQALGEFVQQKIRYVAIEVGVGGNQPHAAADIFSHSYGDCKDKATLLSAMMRAAGMRSTWVMVDTNRGSIAPEAPSIMGNHMIAAIEVPKGYESPQFKSMVTTASGKRYLIFDPTWERTPFGQLESELQGGYGLLVDGADSQVIQLPISKPEVNLVRRKADFRISDDGTLKGSVQETRSGDIAKDWRWVYAEGTRKQQEFIREHVLAHDLTSFRVEGLKAEGVSSLLKDLTISYELEADHFARNMGPLVMIRPRVIGTTGYALDHKLRTIPIDLEEAKRVEDEYDIELPKGYAVDELPRPVSLDLGWAAYQSSSEMRNGKLHYKRWYEVRDVTLPAEKYSDLQHLASVIEEDEQSTAIFKKVN